LGEWLYPVFGVLVVIFNLLVWLEPEIIGPSAVQIVYPWVAKGDSHFSSDCHLV